MVEEFFMYFLHRIIAVEVVSNRDPHAPGSLNGYQARPGPDTSNRYSPCKTIRRVALRRVQVPGLAQHIHKPADYLARTAM